MELLAIPPPAALLTFYRPANSPSSPLKRVPTAYILYKHPSNDVEII
jgi:hypothetical protein